MRIIFSILFGLWLGYLLSTLNIDTDTKLFWIIAIPSNMFFCYLSDKGEKP